MPTSTQISAQTTKNPDGLIIYRRLSAIGPPDYEEVRTLTSRGASSTSSATEGPSDRKSSIPRRTSKRSERPIRPGPAPVSPPSGTGLEPVLGPAPDLTVPVWERQRPAWSKGTYSPAAYFAVYPELQCTRTTRQGTRCLQVVMPGQTQCRIHLKGIARPGAQRGKPAKTGAYATSIWQPTAQPVSQVPHPPKKYLSAMRHAPKLRQLYEQYWADPELMNLQAEIAMARALLADYTERLSKTLAGKDPDRPLVLEDAQRHMISLTEQIGKLVERKHKMDFGEQRTVTINALDSYAARIAEIIMTEVLPLEGGNRAIERIRTQFVILFGNDGQPLPIRPASPALPSPSSGPVESPEEIEDGEWSEVPASTNREDS